MRRPNTPDPVFTPLMISTNSISGAGLKKCMPRNRRGFLSAAPMAVIEIEEVFEARMHCSLTMVSSSEKRRLLDFQIFNDCLNN